MKENREVTDTNVGDIEEAIERLEYIDRTYSCNNYYSIWDLKCIEILLSDYKRVLKENEELLQEKINNQKIIALAQNDMLNYQAGFEDGKNGRTSAVQSIIENQQYYIFQKQIEKYERHIEKLQKENEELIIDNDIMKQDLNGNVLYVDELEENYISKQKIKDKIEEYKRDVLNLDTYPNFSEQEVHREIVEVLQELLESGENYE